MSGPDAGAEAVSHARAALARDPQLAGLAPRLTLSCRDGALTVEGEAPAVPVKRRALRALAAVPAVVGIVDRLHVRPAQRMEDGEVLGHVCNSLSQEPALANLSVRAGAAILHDPPDAQGGMTVRVERGVVTLDGDVPGLAQKRLAGLLAWWVPGSTDVVNGLAVTPPEPDTDDELVEAVRVALEKDPFVNAGQVRVHCRDSEVRLEGYVATAAERDMAEHDAWYVFGVEGVANHIGVRS